jgi:hypothetical protein
MVDERAIQPSAGRCIEWLAQVDAAVHFRAGMGTQLVDRVIPPSPP